MPGFIPFIPGRLIDRPHPLARFLPPSPEGVVTAWLHDHVSPGSWVLDPFGSIPELPVEAARAGYRVLVTANNPVSQFLLEMAATPSSEQDLRGALAEIASIRKGDQRMEPLIQSLYLTLCAKCGREVTADAYIWEKNASTPFARLYSCPHCGDEGERPVIEKDLNRLAQFAASGLHQAWALERVTPVNDPDRIHAKEALAVYLPRAQYALFNLITKLEGISQTSARQRLTDALLLSACDRASNLWPYPTTRARPRQLITPTRHYEHNVWKALEDAVDTWSQTRTEVPISIWPELAPESGGITIFGGRLTRLSAQLGDMRFASVLASLPRPNQAFWTLSTIWSAWLWGHDSLGSFKTVLRRRRYDWSWHASALYATYEKLVKMVEPDAPIFGISAEAEPGLLSSTVVAATYAGMDLKGIALRPSNRQVQLSWTPGKAARKATEFESDPGATSGGVAGRAGRSFLAARGEPASYLYLHAAALQGLADADLPGIKVEEPFNALAMTQDTIQQISSYREGFLRFGGSPHSLEVGLWWLVDESDVQAPLSDRVEAELVNLLQDRPGALASELDAAICKAFGGLLTPETNLVQACLESYGEPNDDHPPLWRLAEHESASQRTQDEAEIRELLFSLGSKLSYRVDGKSPVRWVDAEDQVGYSFYITTSAEVGALLTDPESDPSHSLIVIPGGRANLVLFKLKQDPRLASAVESGWRFLKFRHLRRLTESEILQQNNLDDQLDLDPLTFTEPQILLL